jgi:hypothetical protein
MYLEEMKNQGKVKMVDEKGNVIGWST